jgi:hypothetical protein
MHDVFPFSRFSCDRIYSDIHGSDDEDGYQEAGDSMSFNDEMELERKSRLPQPVPVPGAGSASA